MKKLCWLMGFIMVIVFCTAKKQEVRKPEYSYGGMIRGESSKKQIALVFTADEHVKGSKEIIETLTKEKVKASFFFTGNFYRNNNNHEDIRRLLQAGHYLGGHSDRHLLYCSWENRDSLLVSKKEFLDDYYQMILEMDQLGIDKEEAKYFLPPYEWYNDSISAWTEEAGGILVNFTPGTLSNADYTVPGMKNYRSSQEIFNSILAYEKEKGLEGFILLLHYGVSPQRDDLMSGRLRELIQELRKRGYQFIRIDTLFSFFHES